MSAAAKGAKRNGEAARGERAGRDYTVGEEIANSVTHGVGVAFSIVALTLLIGEAALHGDGRALAGGIVFGISLILLYTGSTLYHAIPFPKARHVFKIIDHSAIYLLIAGTYTPFALVTLRRGWGWWLFSIVWALAAAGIMIDLIPKKRPRALAVTFYLGMGWLAVVAIPSLARALPLASVLWLAAGGLLYTAGTPFYALDKKLRHAHGVWHLFVLAGAASHFLAVWLYIA